MAAASNMKAIVFAGGIGTRMWPLSRKKSPKQFEPVINQKSTLQLTVDRLIPEFPYENIFISTGIQYVDIIKRQLPQIPKANIIGEPEMRDVGPAVGYLMALIAKSDPQSPVAIVWSDHLVENVPAFKNALLTGGKYLNQNPGKYVFIGQRARFANQNLGWIEFGQVLETLNGIEVREFISWHYRPEYLVAKQYFRGGHHAWNPGYFVVTPNTVLAAYKEFAPQMYQDLMRLQASYGTPNHIQDLQALYPKFDKISFDDLIVTKIPHKDAVVLSVDMDWSDVGTWEALKEAMQKDPEENLTHGQTVTYQTKNSVVYSYTDQLVTAVDVEDMVVVVTKDTVLVTKQKSIPKIKEMLKTFAGTDKEKYT